MKKNLKKETTFHCGIQHGSEHNCFFKMHYETRNTSKVKYLNLFIYIQDGISLPLKKKGEMERESSLCKLTLSGHLI